METMDAVEQAIAEKDLETIVNPDPEFLKPLEGRLILKKMRLQERNAAGLFLPEEAQIAKGTCYARVVKAATHRLATDQVTRIPMQVQQGMVVLVNEYAGLPIGRTKDYIIMTEIEVLGIHEGGLSKGSGAPKSETPMLPTERWSGPGADPA